MTIPYFEKGSANPQLKMNKPAEEVKPAAWRSRERGSAKWRVHSEDPTENLKRYARGQYEVEPLLADALRSRIVVCGGAE